MMMLALAPLLLTAALESEVTTLAGLKGSSGAVDGVGGAATPCARDPGRDLRSTGDNARGARLL